MTHLSRFACVLAFAAVSMLTPALGQAGDAPLTRTNLAEAQPAKRVYRVALIHSDASAARESFDAFRHGVTELGYVEGETIALEYRYTEGQDERLAGIVADLVRLKVDAIVTGSTIAARAAQTASRTIPIVMAGTGDPVAAGLARSRASRLRACRRPGSRPAPARARRCRRAASARRRTATVHGSRGATRRGGYTNSPLRDHGPRSQARTAA